MEWSTALMMSGALCFMLFGALSVAGVTSWWSPIPSLGYFTAGLLIKIK